MEHPAADLQSQVDQLTLALRQWRETRDHTEPMEQRLLELTERCAEIVNRWNVTSERHARAVSEVEARLQHWNTIESRLEQDSTQRVRELSEIIRREWEDLRRIHEEPVQQLRDQAAALGETCMAAASLAVRGFERTEARLAALETDLYTRLNQLSRDIQTALVPARPRPAEVAPFPLDGVMRIHEELREDAGEPARPKDTARAEDARFSTPALAERVDSLERELSSEREEVRRSASTVDHLRRNWRTVLAVGVAMLVVIAYFGFQLRRYIDTRLNDAAARVAAAERQAVLTAETANKQVAANRADADRQIAEARHAALQAQVASAVSVAPDVIRFNLVPADATSSTTAQVLWSRSTGLVLSAFRLAAAPAGTTYQIWLMSNTVPIAAGQFVPDRNGRATIALDNPSGLPRPINGVMVTLEPAGGAPTPSATPVLIRPPQ